MTSYKEEGPHTIMELLYNKKHKCGRFVVENSFNILKKTFQELLGKINLHVTFVPMYSLIVVYYIICYETKLILKLRC